MKCGPGRATPPPPIRWAQRTARPAAGRPQTGGLLECGRRCRHVRLDWCGGLAL